MSLQFENDSLPSINPGERHVPAALLVDKSGSMNGVPINELNQGLREFGNALSEDSLALGRAEVSVISFNSSVQTEVGFRPASEYEAPVLSANGLTALNEAILAGLDAIESRKQHYRENGIDYYRPWLFVLTDGAPTDTHLESEAKNRLQDAIRNKKVNYIPMSVGEGADIRKLQEYYPAEAAAKPVLKADKNHFKEAFVWLSKSISEVSKSDPSVVSEVKTAALPTGLTIGL